MGNPSSDKLLTEEKEETYEAIPSAKRLIKSLRDIGYDFSTAVADLVDNSIEAKASRVEIVIGFYGNDSYVRVSDNGRGMNIEELKEAMRYGSERNYQEDDLGKFGLGLKTASMSQSQRFSVASRTEHDTKNLPVFCWDLDHIEKANKWEVLHLRDQEAIELITSPISENSGTVVLWERLDSIISFKQPDGEAAKKKLISMCKELEVYLAMVFHKFLDGEIPGKKLEIYLNGNKIRSWDPFARSESKTKPLSPITIKLIQDGKEGKIILKPFILPTKEEFSSPEEFKRLSGIANWNQQQGFYIYRAGRMIQSGGWCGLRVPDEHTKLSRIELNFSPVFDNSFKINVAKMRVQLPVQVRESVDKAISPVTQLSRAYYDGTVKGQTKFSTYPTGTTSSVIIKSPEKEFLSQKDESYSRYGIIKTFTIDEIEKEAKDSAIGMEKDVISRVFVRVRNKLTGRK